MHEPISHWFKREVRKESKRRKISILLSMIQASNLFQIQSCNALRGMPVEWEAMYPIGLCALAIPH